MCRTANNYLSACQILNFAFLNLYDTKEEQGLWGLRFVSAVWYNNWEEIIDKNKKGHCLNFEKNFWKFLPCIQCIVVILYLLKLSSFVVKGAMGCGLDPG